MKKKFEKILSFLIVFAVIASIGAALPVNATAHESNPASCLIEENINLVLPESVYLEDATWADNSPVNNNIQSEFQISDDNEFEDFYIDAMSAEIVALSDDTGDYIIYAPYSYDSNTAEKVNLNTGGIVYETIDYVLPGKNGLDLVIGRRYDSERANLCNAFFASTGSLPGGSAQQTKFSPNDYFTNLYGLGHGWAFMFSSIQGSVLHLSDGRSIGIRNNRLDNYPSSDLELSLHSSYNNGSVNSRHVLTYKDGRREFFCANGRLIGISDRYNNTINLIHAHSRQSITITDTLGRRTTIIKGADDVITVSLPDSVKLYYNTEVGESITIVNDDDTSAIFLTSYTDPMGIETRYDYTIERGFVNAVEKSITSAAIQRRENAFINLTTITHPTGAITHFTYEGVEKNYGSAGLQWVYRITSREDRIGTSVFNRKEYSYSANNHSGRPEHNNPSSLPWNFTYETTVFIPASGITEKYSFNNQHNTTQIDTKHGSFNVSNRLLSEYSGKRPCLITTRVYDRDNNDLFVETIERFQYDGRENVTISWSPLANGSWNNTEYRTTYTYNSDFNQLTSVTYQQDASTTIRIDYTLNSGNRHPETERVFVNDVQKGRTDWVYDSFGNIISERRYITGDNNVNNSILTEYEYDRGAYINSVKIDDVTTRYEYDTLGRLIKSIDPNENATSYEYNARNDLIRVIYPDSSRRQWARSYTHNYITFTNELGTKMTTRYDQLGRETEIISGGYLYNDEGQLILTNGQPTLTSDSSIFSRNAYDNLSRLTRSTDLINNSVNYFSYDHLSRVVDVLTEHGDNALARESYHYSVQNGLHRTQHTIHGDANAPSIITASYVNNRGLEAQTGVILNGTEHIDVYSYDYVGNIIQYSSAFDRERGLPNATARLQYDHAGRVVRETNTLNQSVVYVYDALGRNTSITDPTGNETTFRYDSLGRLIRQTIPFERINNITHFAETIYVYDKTGNLTSEQTKNNARNQEETWSQTNYTYNNRNQLTRVDNLNNGAVEMNTYYTYDAAGNIVSQTTGGATTAYAYDKHNNVNRITDALGQIETFNFDLAGNLTSKTDRNGITTTYTYDGLGRLRSTNAGGSIITQSYTFTGQLRSISGGGFTQTNTYDALSRLVRQEEPGTVKTYTYDLGGNRTSFQSTINGVNQNNTSYAYDDLNRLIGVNENENRVATYTYDTNGNRASLTLGNGVGTDYTYNLANLVTSLTNRQGENVLSSYSYLYNFDGNQRAKTDHTGRNTNYTYDNLGRLTREAESTGSQISYTYDNCGNRATMNNNGVVTNYNYDLNNRLLNTVTDGMTANFTYDANGNQLSDGTTAYTYDSFNRMTSAGATAFTYRPDGLRHSVTTNYIATTHIWDGANIAVDIMGANVVKYVRGIGLINSSAGNFYIFNANGDVVQLADSAGAVTRNYHYDAFGNEINPDKHDTNPFRYSGEYWDGTFKGVSDIWQTYPEYNTPYCVLKPAGTALNYTFTEQISIQNLPSGNYVFDLSVEFFKNLGESRNVQVKIFEDSKTIYDESFDSSVTKPINLVLSGGSTLTIEYNFNLQGAEEMASAAALRNLRRSTGTAEIYGPEMYYLRARYYDPATSRMLSEDPYWRMQRIYEYNPQGLNLYAYVMNNPIRYADPSGLDAILINKKIDLAPWSRIDHMSAFFQDAANHWHYFSWQDTVIYHRVVFNDTFKSYDDIFNNIDSINSYLQSHGLIEDVGFHSGVYIKGDFLASHEAATGLLMEYNFSLNSWNGRGIANKDYFLLGINCGDIAMQLLYKGTLPDGTNVRDYARANGLGISPIPNMNLQNMQNIFYNKSTNLSGFDSSLQTAYNRYIDFNPNSNRSRLEKITASRFNTNYSHIK